MGLEQLSAGKSLVLEYQINANDITAKAEIYNVSDVDLYWRAPDYYLKLRLPSRPLNIYALICIVCTFT